VQPHFHRITSPDQVQIYQSIMADSQQAHTFRLLAGATDNKDNRITPHGWKAEEAARQDLGSPGTENDPDFVPGQDTVQYIIPLASSSETSSQWNISARLLYQNLSHRFADELFALDTTEIQTLRNALDNSLPTETVAAVNRTVQF
jgi:hypothetical protein